LVGYFLGCDDVELRYRRRKKEGAGDSPVPLFQKSQDGLLLEPQVKLLDGPLGYPLRKHGVTVASVDI